MAKQGAIYQNSFYEFFSFSCYGFTTNAHPRGGSIVTYYLMPQGESFTSIRRQGQVKNQFGNELVNQQGQNVKEQSQNQVLTIGQSIG
jgi:hypothetical protein